MDVVDVIRFEDMVLNVYSHPSTEEPCFRLKDIDSVKILDEIEADEFFKCEGEIYLTEMGLYNVLAHQNSPKARIWRRVIFEQLRSHRLFNHLSMSEQFEDWQEEADKYYIDEETGKLMMSITVEGGDVIQVPA